MTPCWVSIKTRSVLPLSCAGADPVSTNRTPTTGSQRRSMVTSPSVLLEPLVDYTRRVTLPAICLVAEGRELAAQQLLNSGVNSRDGVDDDQYDLAPTLATRAWSLATPARVCFRLGIAFLLRFGDAPAEEFDESGKGGFGVTADFAQGVRSQVRKLVIGVPEELGQSRDGLGAGADLADGVGRGAADAHIRIAQRLDQHRHRRLGGGAHAAQRAERLPPHVWGRLVVDE